MRLHYKNQVKKITGIYNHIQVYYMDDYFSISLTDFSFFLWTIRTLQDMVRTGKKLVNAQMVSAIFHWFSVIL
jgi:hypothetical protein